MLWAVRAQCYSGLLGCLQNTSQGYCTRGFIIFQTSLLEGCAWDMNSLVLWPPHSQQAECTPVARGSLQTDRIVWLEWEPPILKGPGEGRMSRKTLPPSQPAAEGEDSTPVRHKGKAKNMRELEGLGSNVKWANKGHSGSVMCKIRASQSCLCQGKSFLGSREHPRQKQRCRNLCV